MLELLETFEKFFAESNPELACSYNRELYRSVALEDPTIRLCMNADAGRLNTVINRITNVAITPGILNRTDLGRDTMLVAGMSEQLLGKGSRIYKWSLKLRESVVNKEKRQDETLRVIKAMIPNHLKGDKIGLYNSLEERNSRIEAWKKSRLPRVKNGFVVLQSTKCSYSSRGLYEEFAPYNGRPAPSKRERTRSSSSSSSEEDRKKPKSKYQYSRR